MDVIVSSRNVEVSDALRAAAEEKIGRLDRFLDGMERAEVRFSEERNPRIADKEVCEVTLEGHGHHVRARVAAADAFAAIDAAEAKLEQQLHKLKTKVQKRHQRRAAPPPVAEPLPDDLIAPTPPGLAGEGPDDEAAGEGDDDEARYRIVRSKRFAMKPMTPEEAALQMDLLGHDFFFFRNADTGRAAVVYWRGAGDVGLIDEAG